MIDENSKFLIFVIISKYFNLIQFFDKNNPYKKFKNLFKKINCTNKFNTNDLITLYFFHK